MGSIRLTYVQLIPGHEAVGKVVGMGEKVDGFQMGDRIAADVSGGHYRQPFLLEWRLTCAETCRSCYYCRKGQIQFCEKLSFAGVTRDGESWCSPGGATAEQYQVVLPTT